MTQHCKCKSKCFKRALTRADVAPFNWEADGARLRKRPKLKDNPDVARTFSEWSGDYPDAPPSGQEVPDNDSYYSTGGWRPINLGPVGQFSAKERAQMSPAYWALKNIRDAKRTDMELRDALQEHFNGNTADPGEDE